METLYVRITRENKTFFFVCRPTDLIDSLRRKLATFFNYDINDIRLYLDKRVKFEHYLLLKKKIKK